MGRWVSGLHRSGHGAVVSLAGAQDVDALRGKRGAPLQLHCSLDRLNALETATMAERWHPEPLTHTPDDDRCFVAEHERVKVRTAPA